MPGRVAHVRRRPGGRAAESVGAAHEPFDLGPAFPVGLLALEEMVVERQQQPLVHFRAVELAVGGEGVGRAVDAELPVAAFRAAVAVDVAARVQIDLAPDRDRVERHLDLVEPLGRGALAPEIVVGRMLLQQEIEVALLLARRRAVRRMAVDDAVLVPPVGAEEIAQDSALIDRGAVGIVQSVEGGDAGERRRLLDRHPPLRHAEIGLADAADLAVRPGLMAEPFDHVIEVALLGAVQEAELAARPAAAAYVHVGIDIAVAKVEIDRPGLAPQELRARGERIVVVAVGRGREHRWKRPLPFRHVERDGDLDPVMDLDLHLARRGQSFGHAILPSLFMAASVGRAPRRGKSARASWLRSVKSPRRGIRLKGADRKLALFRGIAYFVAVPAVNASAIQ